MAQGLIQAKSSRTQEKTRYNASKLLIGLVFHLVYIGSVFDCYFTSPVVNGMQSHSVGNGDAKRLVLIVGDGLRADLLFNKNPFPNIPDSPEIVAPYLRSIVENRGAFGISHTRVPTESRPGHVALIAGMYEDVSAVTKGWKTNPIDFDSVFNQSSTTFSFGSPDILPMFARGAVPGRVKMWHYNSEDEDFTKDASSLDVWVLDQLQSLLQNATSNPELNRQLRQDKVVFFLHLLGLDTTGHSYRPHSKEYMHNIQVVDDIIRQAERMISKFYLDDDTSYIFTADHGMSVIGNHGDGHPDNTRTPLIAWGSGVRGPLRDSIPSSHDVYSQPWHLTHLYRRDVEQADITALMSVLLGINWPGNSVGELPDVDPSRPGFLEPRAGNEMLARAALVNAKVILEQYRVKHELKQAHTLFYKPYLPLESASSTIPVRISEVDSIEYLIKTQKWNEARLSSQYLIKTALKGLHHLQTYDRFLIRALVTAAYTGWAAYASLYIFRPLDQVPPDPLSSAIATAVSLVVLVLFWISCALQRSPWTFYLYILFPCYFWREVFVHTSPFIRNWSTSKIRRVSYSSIALRGAMVVGALQGMVVGYTHRSVWSIGFMLIGIVWPLSWSEEVKRQTGSLRFAWSGVCTVMAVFPLLNVDKQETLVTILIGGCVMLLIGGIAAVRVLEEVRDQKSKDYLRNLYIFQGFLVILAALITVISVTNLQARRGLPVYSQIMGWVVLVSSLIVPFSMERKNTHTVDSKLLMYFLGFAPYFVILSISDEGLFYTAFSATLYSWLKVERVIRWQGSKAKEASSKKTRSEAYVFQPDDLRIALFFLLFVQVGFFGTGNVASIASFYLDPVFRLIPVFSPFWMAGLLILKIFAPYVMLAANFAALNDALHLPPSSLLLVALTLTDGMTLKFFFNVQDTGSWLEIGQSITFFCIASLLLLWSAGVCAVGEYLMSNVIPHKSIRD